VELKKEIEQGKFIGPRLLVAGKGICTTGGHGGLFALVIGSNDEAGKAVRTNTKAGVDLCECH
jgi:hypothetical protein